MGFRVGLQKLADGVYTWYCHVHQHSGPAYDTKEEAEKAIDEHADLLLPAAPVQMSSPEEGTEESWQWRCALCGHARQSVIHERFIYLYSSYPFPDEASARAAAEIHNWINRHTTNTLVKSANKI